MKDTKFTLKKLTCHSCSSLANNVVNVFKLTNGTL